MSKEQPINWESLQEQMRGFLRNYFNPQNSSTMIGRNNIHVQHLRNRPANKITADISQCVETLTKFLTSYPNIANVCTNPTMLRHVCHFAALNMRAFTARCTTVKYLYDIIIAHFFFFYFENESSTTTIAAIFLEYPIRLSTSFFVKELNYLMSLAFKTLNTGNDFFQFDIPLNNELKIGKSTMQRSSEKLKKQLLKANLIQAYNKESHETATTESYMFVDATLRNYLVARYIALQIVRNEPLIIKSQRIMPLDFIKTHWRNAGYREIIAFIAGFLVDSDLFPYNLYERQKSCFNDFYLLLATENGIENSLLGQHTQQLIQCWNETDIYAECRKIELSERRQTELTDIVFDNLKILMRNSDFETVDDIIEALRLAPFVRESQSMRNHFLSFFSAPDSLDEKFSQKRHFRRLQGAYILYRLGQPLIDEIADLFLEYLSYEHSLFIVFIHLLAKEPDDKKREKHYELLRYSSWGQSCGSTEQSTFRESLDIPLPAWFNVPPISEPRFITFIYDMFINACERDENSIRDFANSHTTKYKDTTIYDVNNIIYRVKLLTETLTPAARDELVKHCTEQCNELGIDPELMFPPGDGRDNSMDASPATSEAQAASSTSTVKMVVSERKRPSSVFQSLDGTSTSQVVPHSGGTSSTLQPQQNAVVSDGSSSLKGTKGPQSS